MVFFGIQIAGIIIGRFTEVKYFCWAPYDQITRYSISVTINDSDVSPKQIEERYHKSASGFENRNINNLINIIQQYETTYGIDDKAQVKLNYQINKGKTQTWEWPKINSQIKND